MHTLPSSDTTVSLNFLFIFLGHLDRKANGIKSKEFDFSAKLEMPARSNR